MNISLPRQDLCFPRGPSTEAWRPFHLIQGVWANFSEFFSRAQYNRPPPRDEIAFPGEFGPSSPSPTTLSSVRGRAGPLSRGHANPRPRPASLGPGCLKLAQRDFRCRRLYPGRHAPALTTKVDGIEVELRVAGAPRDGRARSLRGGLHRPHPRDPGRLHGGDQGEGAHIPSRPAPRPFYADPLRLRRFTGHADRRARRVRL